MKTAIVIGATGLVGSNLLQELLQDNRFGTVITFSRRASGIKNEKLQEHIIDFDKPENWQHHVKGDVLFSALGTTIGKAGSKEAQYKIDYSYQYQFAEAASANGVHTYVLVSSAGADPDSRIFYSRMKGELEQAVRKLPFQNIHLIRPGLLAGERNEKRIGEEIGYVVLNIFTKLPGLGKWKPIHGNTVAKAMINAAVKSDSKSRAKVKTHTLNEVFAQAGA